MGLISKETATEIAYAYREIETAETLLGEVVEALDRRQSPDIRDAFGRHQDGLQLGVPTGRSGQRLFNVPGGSRDRSLRRTSPRSARASRL